MSKSLAVLAVSLLLGAGSPQAQKPPTTFFITSVGSGNGADLGGRESVERHRESFDAVARVPDVEGHAYLSNVATDGKPAGNAKARIGPGPRYDANGVKVAENADDLHSDKNELSKENSVTEKGATVN